MNIRRFIRSLYLRAAPLRSFDEKDLTEHPHDLFHTWFSEAHAVAGLYLPEAMTLSTTDAEGQPSSRTVLLKDHRREGYDFYTNLNSQKAQHLAQNGKCALLFHWNILHRQIRIEGHVERLGDDVADAYFATRPRESQIGAWASHQSEALKNRQELQDRTEEVEQRYSQHPVPRPPHWGGYRVIPVRYEFWQGRAGRLHDRFRYSLHESQWQYVRLSP